VKSEYNCEVICIVPAVTREGLGIYGGHLICMYIVYSSQCVLIYVLT